MAEQKKEVQKLQKGKSYVTVVGKAKVNDKTYALDQGSKNPNSDYIYSRLNLGVQTAEGNVVYGEAMGGYSSSMNYPIKVKTKEGEATEISWSDRLTESVVETIRDYDTFRVGLIRDGEEPAEGEEDTRKLVVKRFLSAYDAIPYIKENLKDGMMIMVKGSYGFRNYKDEDQKAFKIESIFLSKQESGFANFVQTVLIDEDSITKEALKEAKKTGEIAISARVVDYVGKVDGKKIGKNMTFNFPFHVKINQENPEQTEKIVSTLFKVKKNKIREITIEGQIFEGYDQAEVSAKDIELSADVKELIAMGLYSMEEAKEKMTVRGNKVSKMLFTRPFILKDKDDAKKIKMDFSDDKYVPEDLIVNIEEEEEKHIDFSGVGDEETSNEGDNSWLAGLGLGE